MDIFEPSEKRIRQRLRVRVSEKEMAAAFMGYFLVAHVGGIGNELL